ncbi:MAG: hypothetical protein ACR2QO_10920 [Acidimicrobiales bacterium]
MLLQEDRSLLAVLRPAALSVGLGLIWLVLAWRTPTATHHFAPMVVAAAWGFAASIDDQAAAWRAAVAGVAVAVLTLAVLGASGHLLGPTLWHSRPSWPELLGFSLLGGVITLVRAKLAGRQSDNTRETLRGRKPHRS